MAIGPKNGGVVTSMILRNHRGSGRRPVYTSCLAVLLLISVGINVLLTREIRGLTSVIDQLKREGREKLTAQVSEQLRAGQTLSKIEVQGADGVKIRLDRILDDKPTVLYVFSPDCHWCTRNLESIKALANGIKERHRIIGLSVTDSGLQEYVSQNGLPFPVYTIMPSGAGGLVSRTPHTLVVSREGKVIANWFGAYGREVRRKVEQYFQLALPGIAGDASGSPEPSKLECEG